MTLKEIQKDLKRLGVKRTTIALKILRSKYDKNLQNKIIKKRIYDRVSESMSTKDTFIFKCKYCGKISILLDYKVNRRKIYCSYHCAAKDRIREVKDPNSFNQYRRKCFFRFSVYDFPDEFNLRLINKYGWYKNSNSKKNHDGIVRDHMVSIRYGYDNQIDPNIMKHPANCRLINARINQSKNIKNSITFEKLTELIYKWNNKYGQIVLTGAQ